MSYTRSQKINAHVNFDFELDLSDYCVTETPGPLGDPVTGDHVYDLVSVIMHHGTGFGSGHYSSYNWNNIAGQYWRYVRISTTVYDSIINSSKDPSKMGSTYHNTKTS